MAKARDGKRAFELSPERSGHPAESGANLGMNWGPSESRKMGRRGQDQQFLGSGKDWRTEEGTGYLLGVNLVFLPLQFRECWGKSQEPNTWARHPGGVGSQKSRVMFVWVGNYQFKIITLLSGNILMQFHRIHCFHILFIVFSGVLRLELKSRCYVCGLLS